MPFRCMENESPKMCGSCEATCDHPYVPLCLDECRPGQCQCNAGYVRNGDGKCVPESVCEKGAKQGTAFPLRSGDYRGYISGHRYAAYADMCTNGPNAGRLRMCLENTISGAAGEDRRFVLEMLKRQKMISSVNNPIVKRDTGKPVLFSIQVWRRSSVGALPCPPPLGSFVQRRLLALTVTRKYLPEVGALPFLKS